MSGHKRSGSEARPVPYHPRMWSPTGIQRFTNSPASVVSLSIVFATCFAILGTSLWGFTESFRPSSSRLASGPETYPPISSRFKKTILSRCAALRAIAGPPANFHSRDQSDRFEQGTNATLIRNAVIFTGRDNGTEVIHGDLLLDKGIIRGIGKISGRILNGIENLTTVDADGGWVTPGLVDLHTHLGVLSLPILGGAVDLNSAKGPIAPWLRSIDGMNTHDEGYELAMAGGVTSAQILPGSTNAIGGQAFIIKLRKPKDRSASSMVVEPPPQLINPTPGSGDHTPYHWRHLKQVELTQACGENLKGYGNRMDTMWALRSAYAEATKINLSQDEYCDKAEAGLWDSLVTPFPEDLRWEMLVDVLRGKVKISTHCYEAVDLDSLVRLSNEFKFPIATIHHASEAWLVPHVLKRMWGGIPSIAIFATNHRYKREAYRGSEFAGRVLADEGIPVIMKSDHPVINSRYLMQQAQQAHYFGLAPNLALASVTSEPAKAAGLSHRIGILSEGSDADVVLWDSHPLRLGATPRKVWVDGIVQIPVPSKTDEENNVEIGKGKDGDEWKEVPETPNWDKERKQAIKWDGLPPLEGRKTNEQIIFTDVKEVWKRTPSGALHQAFKAHSNEDLGLVIVKEGKIICAGECMKFRTTDSSMISLEGGSISPGIMTFGSALGLEEIAGEPSTVDGESYDAFAHKVPEILNDPGAIVRAADALIFGTRDALTAYRAGVTLATSSLARPIYLAGPDAHVISGLSTSFRTGAGHAMERGAIVQDVAALHVVMGRSHPAAMARGISVSTQLAGLRRLLYGWESSDKDTGAWFKKAAEGVVPLVIEVDSLDIMANLLILKGDVENNIGSRMRMVFSGAMEAHLLAKEIGDAGVGVILNPIRPIPMVWDQRRIMPGPPLSNDTALAILLEEGVTVGLGIRSAWEARNTRFDVQLAALESNGRISQDQTYDLVSRNLEKLLGIRGIDEETSDLVIYRGGTTFELSSKVIGIVSPSHGFVDLF